VAVTRGWLLDKSALSRSHQPAVLAALAPRLRATRLFTCAIIDLEVLYSARNAAEYSSVAHERRRTYEWVEMDAETWARAARIQSDLAVRAHLRAAGIADLLIAATAEQHGLTVLHYDRDFETLGRLCGVREEAVVPLGSLP
jgi:predicted nucleic acid-binding protein